MFFILSKILAFLITPLVWVIALLLLAIFSKNERRKKRSLLLSAVLLVFFSNNFVFDEFMHAWEIEPTPLTALDSTYDVGIVLGGMLRYDQKFDRLQFDRGSDRLLQAIELYKNGRIKKILFSGGSGSILIPEAKEAFYAKRFLLTLGITEEDIIIESESRNTKENAEFTKKILVEKFPQGKFLLITSAFHMRRAMGCFTKAGIATTPYSTDRFTGPRKFAFDHLIIPNIDALFGWHTLIHEFTGYVVYKLRFGI